MKINGFGYLMRLGIVVWSILCLYWAGDATVASARALPNDHAMAQLHALGFLVGQGLIFATWIGPTLAMTVFYAVFGRSPQANA